VQGGAGNDVIDGDQGGDVAILGADDDHFVWNPGDGSDVVEGQEGADAISLFGSNIGEKIDLSANGSRLRLARDIGTVVMDAAGIETVGYMAFGGADTVTVGDLTATGITDVDADLAGTIGGSTGDGLGDHVIVKGTDGDDAIDVVGSAGGVAIAGLAARVDVSHAEPADTLTIDTLAGVDTVDDSGLAPGTVQLAVL
jgi:hypothetical protein